MEHAKSITKAEEIMHALEDEIPALAVTATSKAYQQALASGSTVLVSDKGGIWEVFPNGTRQFVKKVPARVSVTEGETFSLR